MNVGIMYEYPVLDVPSVVLANGNSAMVHCGDPEAAYALWYGTCGCHRERVTWSPTGYRTAVYVVEYAVDGAWVVTCNQGCTWRARRPRWLRRS